MDIKLLALDPCKKVSHLWTTFLGVGPAHVVQPRCGDAQQ